MSQLQQIKRDLRNAITEHLGDGIKKMLELLDEDSRKHTLILQLSGRYHYTKNQQMGGVAHDSNTNLSYNQIRNAVLETIRELQEDDLKKVIKTTKDSHLTPTQLPDPALQQQVSLLQRKLSHLEGRLLRIEGTDASMEFRLQEEIETIKNRIATLS